MESILQTTLAGVIQQLADFFGMTTEVIMQNAPVWLAKYGWFSLMQILPGIIALWVFVIVVVLGIIIWIGYENDWKDKTTVIVCILSALMLTLVLFSAWFIQCAISPELYGLKAILALLK